MNNEGGLILPHQRWRQDKAAVPMSVESSKVNKKPFYPKMPVLNVDKKTPYTRSKEDHLIVQPLILNQDLPAEERKESDEVVSRGKTPNSGNGSSFNQPASR